jgi:hypothetical protein
MRKGLHACGSSSFFTYFRQPERDSACFAE